jgi:uncharacterized secreted protein with C-terminal beta-propeller domain
MIRLRNGLLFVLLGWAGCDVLFPPEDTNPTAETSLKSFATEDEFRNYVRGELSSRSENLSTQNVMFNRDEALESAPTADIAGGAVAPPAAPSAANGGAAADYDGGEQGDYSQTTTQEEGVDESDVVKTDGTFLYIIDDSTENGSTLRIVRAWPREQLATLGELPLDGYGREIYLHDGKLIALTATYGGMIYLGEPAIDSIGAVEGETKPGANGEAEVEAAEDVRPDDSTSVDATVDLLPRPSDGAAPFYRFERPSMTVTVVNVADPATPAVLSKTKFDGSPSASRMIDGVLHLVLANYQNYYFDVMPFLGREEFDADSVDAELILPRYEQTGADGQVRTGELLTWQDVYYPSERDGFGVVAIASLNVSDSTMRASGIVAEPGLIYSSLDALYLTNTNYDFTGNLRETTNVYKLAYVDGRAMPVAAGKVDGRVLNQYSMGEYNGVLRVATTVGPTFTLDGQFTEPHNNVYCLADVNGALQTLGSIQDIAPRETIQSARFIGERGFVVTFEQIDPLFTLDLSDPTNPRIVGELKVPGFSTYMVPIDENHLMSIGQYVPEDRARSWGVQLSIFDVSDFAKPTLKHQVVLGNGEDEGGAWSEALYDPKALAYYATEGLLALPLNIYPRYDYAIPAVPIEAVDPVTGIGTDGSDEGVSGGGATGSSGSGVPVAIDGVPIPDDATGTSDSDSGIAAEDPVEWRGYEGIVVYRVSAESGFQELGRIDTYFERPGFYTWTSFSRGVFIGDDVYAVTNLGVRTVPVSDVAAAPAEVFYGRGYPIDPYPIPLFDEDRSDSEGSVEATDGAVVP